MFFGLYQRLLIAVLVLILTACQSVQPIEGHVTGITVRRSTPLFLGTSTLQIQPPTETPQPIYLPSNQATGGYQAAARTPQPTMSPTATLLPTVPSPTQVIFELCSPLEGVRRVDLARIVSDPYNEPPPYSDARHEGVDFAFYNWKGFRQIAGVGIQAILPGTVAAALEGTYPYGGFVIVETPVEALPEDVQMIIGAEEGKSLYHLYAHMQEGSVSVELGETVSACQVVGKVGKTGNTLAAHLHLETRFGPPGGVFPAMSYYTEYATKEEKLNYRLWRTSWKYQHFDPLRLLGYDFVNWVTETPTPMAPKPRYP